MDLEARYGGKSSFYFLVLETNDVNFGFRIEQLGDELRHIVSRGWDVGLHGGHTAYLDPHAIRREKDRLESAVGQKVCGYRNH